MVEIRTYPMRQPQETIEIPGVVRFLSVEPSNSLDSMWLIHVLVDPDKPLEMVMLYNTMFVTAPTPADLKWWTYIGSARGRTVSPTAHFFAKAVRRGESY